MIFIVLGGKQVRLAFLCTFHSACSLTIGDPKHLAMPRDHIKCRYDELMHGGAWERAGGKMSHSPTKGQMCAGWTEDGRYAVFVMAPGVLEMRL